MSSPDGDPRAAMMRDVSLHAHLGFHIVRADADGTVIEMPVHPPALNGSGNLHGGAIATLIDVACGMAAGTASGIDRTEQTLVTADVHIRYLGRPKTATVRGEGHVVRVGRQLVVVEGRVVDTAGNVIAAADAAFMVVPLRRPLDVADNVDPQALDL